MNKTCSQCKQKLEQALVANVEVDYCPTCYGMFFEERELEWAKNNKDDNLRWLDVDLWKDETKFQMSRGGKLCPTDNMPMYEVRYGDSDVKLDVCNVCKGIWVDRGEFRGIMEYLRATGTYEVLHSFTITLVAEAWEIFSGPEFVREELHDVVALLKMLRYKFAAQHPMISQVILGLPR
jgi:Zn-finger nucleic acid-binding protein